MTQFDSANADDAEIASGVSVALRFGEPLASIRTMAARTNEPTQPSITLLIGADSAIAHHDMGTLAFATRQLALRTSPSLCSDLLELAELCERDGNLAVRRWAMLREGICAELCSAVPASVCHGSRD